MFVMALSESTSGYAAEERAADEGPDLPGEERLAPAAHPRQRGRDEPHSDEQRRSPARWSVWCVSQARPAGCSGRAR